MSHSTQGTRKQIHNPAEKIRYGSVRQDFQSAADHFRIGSINLKNLRTEEICTASKGKGGNYGNNKTVDQNLIHTFKFMHIHACVTEFTATYRKPKILLAAVYPAMAVDPKELTED